MNKKGSTTVIIILILLLAIVIFIYPLGGGKNIEEISDKIGRLNCPDVNTNITCEFGVDIYKDDRGCVQAVCKTEDAPAHLSETGTLQVFFIDVGQGDGIYIETPTEKHIVIDAGRGNEMADFLTFRGINRIDWLFVTHPDVDHIGGVDEIFQQFVVLNYVKTNISCDTETCNALANVASEEEGLEIHPGYSGATFEGISLDLEILSPNPDLEFKDDNDNSIVMRLVYEDVEILFTGDCSEDCEDMMVRLDKDVSADILKVGHHGSKTATTAGFLAKVNPAYAVLSYGDTNSYGHPTQEVLDRLTGLQIDIVRTASAGDIELRTDGTKLEWFCEKKVNCFG